MKSWLRARIWKQFLLTFICEMPASRMVSVEHVKYLKARSRPSLSKDMCGSIGSLTAVHIRSVMFLVPAVRRSLSDSRHIYLIIIEIIMMIIIIYITIIILHIHICLIKQFRTIREMNKRDSSYINSLCSY